MLTVDDVFRNITPVMNERIKSATKKGSATICSCKNGKLTKDGSTDLFHTEGLCDLGFSCAVMKMELKKLTNIMSRPIFTGVLPPEKPSFAKADVHIPLHKKTLIDDFDFST